VCPWAVHLWALALAQGKDWARDELCDCGLVLLWRIAGRLCFAHVAP
jgi:hypothetical protein